MIATPRPSSTSAPSTPLSRARMAVRRDGAKALRLAEARRRYLAQVALLDSMLEFLEQRNLEGRTILGARDLRWIAACRQELPVAVGRQIHVSIRVSIVQESIYEAQEVLFTRRQARTGRKSPPPLE